MSFNVVQLNSIYIQWEVFHYNKNDKLKSLMKCALFIYASETEILTIWNSPIQCKKLMTIETISTPFCLVHTAT